MNPLNPKKLLLTKWTAVKPVAKQKHFLVSRVIQPELDNGPELTAESFTEWAKEQGIELRFIQPGKPNQNAFIERFNKSFREEVLNANLFNTMSEAQEAAEVWLTDYNEYRPHESLGDMPPAMFKPRGFQPEISTFNL